MATRSRLPRGSPRSLGGSRVLSRGLVGPSPARIGVATCGALATWGPPRCARAPRSMGNYLSRWKRLSLGAPPTLAAPAFRRTPRMVRLTFGRSVRSRRLCMTPSGRRGPKALRRRGPHQDHQLRPHRRQFRRTGLTTLIRRSAWRPRLPPSRRRSHHNRRRLTSPDSTAATPTRLYSSSRVRSPVATLLSGLLIRAPESKKSLQRGRTLGQNQE
mmetsp:Transcript_25823/g.67781  ORF Transcript_25823/g.67781 Transcript_25823/m.67781 type:complete len:215 (-) Transcript_25823:307-951(-)